MSPLVYLAFCKGKNKFLELLRKPLKLFLTLGFVALLIMNFTVSQSTASGGRPIEEFKAIIFAFYILSFITETKKGFQSGGTMFSMADVNLLFMSPVRSAPVLFLGMLSRLGSSLFIGVAFIYQFALLRSYYPVIATDMITAVAVYGAVVFVSQLAGMLIYFYTCGEELKIKKVKTVLYTVCAVFALAVAVKLAVSGSLTLTSFAMALTSLPMRFFPVAGWLFTVADGFMLSDAIKITAGFVPCAVFTVAVFLILAFSKHGYYEDVLLSAEKNADKKAGDGMQPVTKIRKTAGGIKKGKGASVLFYRHMIENRRTKSVLLSPSSLFYLVVIALYGFVLDGDFIMMMSLSCMVSFIPVLSGKWIKELSMPYIYLIPESPAKKLFFILPEMLPKIVVESVLQCALIGYISRLGILTVVLLTVARMSVSFVLIGSALLVVRFSRDKEKNSIYIAISVIPGMIFLLPSVFLCISALNFGLGFVIAFAVMAAVNFSVALMLIFFARNILKVSE